MWLTVAPFLLTLSAVCSVATSFLSSPFHRPITIQTIQSSRRRCPGNILLLWEHLIKCKHTNCAVMSKRTSISNSVDNEVYCGPILPTEIDIIAEATLSELGLDLAVAPSVTVPSQLGLYTRLAEGIESVTIPSMTLLCGYAKRGTFQRNAIVDGGKTVGFLFNSADTAVFLDRQLLSISDALQYAAKIYNSCGLFGHDLQIIMNDDSDNTCKDDGGSIVMKITPIRHEFLDDEQSRRYFVPDMVSRVLNNEEINVKEFVIQNFGQYSNDLAWDVKNPPQGQDEYKIRSIACNLLQLVWRLEYNDTKKCLMPSWPVTIFARDATFHNNAQFMEIGTSYGWNYWDALAKLKL